MRAPPIQSAERLSTLIFADRISGDERRLAFPGPGFPDSALAHGAYDSTRPAFRAPGERTANKPDGANRRQPLRFRESRGESGVLAFTAAVAHPRRSARRSKEPELRVSITV